MKQEDRDLLLKDLSARLPYGVICTDSRHGDSRITQIDINPTNNEISVYYWDFDEYGFIENCKPYLRPMSSMTEEEQIKFSSLCELTTDVNGEKVWSVKVVGYDWLNQHHFDYRGLIDKGLDLEAPEGMYNIKY